MNNYIQSKVDSIITYCMGGGLAWFSCVADKLNPILQSIGLIIGIAMAIAKGYYDFRKYKKYKRKPSNDA